MDRSTDPKIIESPEPTQSIHSVPQMPEITRQTILRDDELRRQGFMFLRMHSEFMMARLQGDHTLQLKAS